MLQKALREVLAANQAKDEKITLLEQQLVEERNQNEMKDRAIVEMAALLDIRQNG